MADLVEYRMQRDLLVQRIDRVPFSNRHGDWHLTAYQSMVDPFPHVALTCGKLGEADASGAVADVADPVLVRMHSQNLLGDVLGDAQQPSGEVLNRSMAMIQDAGCGALVYLRHEGMGRGLLRRLQTAQPLGGGGNGRGGMQLGNTDEAESAQRRRSTLDYGIGSQILRNLGVRRMKLITDHPLCAPSTRRIWPKHRRLCAQHPRVITTPPAK